MRPDRHAGEVPPKTDRAFPATRPMQGGPTGSNSERRPFSRAGS
jgi:hypothetical protein